ncbi:MAG: hypothetical protein ACQCN6_02075 [Candidatus Bathyarchaeia archaeon]
MHIKSKKTAAISILTILLLGSIAIVSAAVYYPEGTHVTSYAQINVAPNPIGIGQTVTVNMYLAVPLETSEYVQNMTLYITDPNGHKETLGPFKSDTTGGTYYTFVPDIIGNYSIYWYYPGQTLGGEGSRGGWNGLITDPSTSPTAILTVQEEPIIRNAYPITPLPNAWWETPVTAQNVQEWYKICGPWLGFSPLDFANTGGMGMNNGFENNVCNPYTSDVLSGHVIWTLPWGAGGIPGGIYGGTESSNYWMTRQYSPNFAPVIMNGVLYSTQYTFAKSTGAQRGIVAIDLYTGEEKFVINTTNPLVTGMMPYYKNLNQYGVVGPFLWTTGTLPASDTGGVTLVNAPGTTQWNMYDAFDGKYVGSIVNGSSGGSYRGMQIALDDQGGLVGYYLNTTAGSQRCYPGVAGEESYIANNTGAHLDCFNFTTALLAGGGFPQPNRNFVIDWSRGVQYAVPTATQIDGKDIAGLPWGIWYVGGYDDTSYTVCMVSGFVHGNVGSGYEQAGFFTVSAMDGVDGRQLMLKNLTTSDTAALKPWTRIGANGGDGKLFIYGGVGGADWKGAAFDLRTGSKLWETTLTPPEGYDINPYDVFNFKSMYANGIELINGFGGDIWALNATTGQQMWVTNTLSLLGDPGLETPYGTWPLWIFAAQCQSANVAYYGIGHEYDPPLFHGAQVIALNMTNGDLIWKELGTYTRAHAIAQGVYISVNEYDNQVYAFAKGPTQLTVSAPSVGVTTATPITISGRVTDVSPGTEQNAVKLNYPNGVPAVSDESQSAFMETVYQQQPMPYNVTGVPINLYVLDANGNYRQIGSTTSDAYGTYTYTWTPDIPGDFTVYANFDGSNSYWPSVASAGFHATEAATTPTPTIATQTGVATTSDLWMGVAVIAVVIIIVGAVLGILLLRKRP